LEGDSAIKCIAARQAALTLLQRKAMFTMMFVECGSEKDTSAAAYPHHPKYDRRHEMREICIMLKQFIAAVEPRID
jgi:hypothetical protein